MKKNKKEVYLPIPELKCYYGIKVTKKTEIEFENEFVKQKIKDLKLISTHVCIGPNFKSITELELQLKQGDILLLEEENRGYFLPKDVRVGSIENVIEECNFMKEQISKIKE